MLVMDIFTRRIIGFGIAPACIDGMSACRMFNAATPGHRKPKYLSIDHDPLFRFHRWLANLRVIEVEEIKSVPYAPVSYPLVERLIGTIRREYLDRVFFWNAVDLARKLNEYKDYYNAHPPRSPLARWHDARAMRRRILSGVRLARLSRLAATLPRSVSDSNPRLPNISPPTRPDHVSVRQEARICNTEHLLQNPLLDEAVRFEPRKKMLRESVITWRSRSSEMVKGQVEPLIDIGLALAVAAKARNRSWVA
jgi:hypothetical protein